MKADPAHWWINSAISLPIEQAKRNGCNDLKLLNKYFLSPAHNSQ
jgi:hypothetical protein